LILQEDKARGTQFTVYHVEIRVKGGLSKTVMKRFHEFREFDDVNSDSFSSLCAR
jgi:hypothetical protein